MADTPECADHEGTIRTLVRRVTDLEDRVVRAESKNQNIQHRLERLQGLAHAMVRQGQEIQSFLQDMEDD